MNGRLAQVLVVGTAGYVPAGNANLADVPDTVSRGAAVVCIAAGVALLARFLAFLVPLSACPTRAVANTIEQPAAL